MATYSEPTIHELFDLSGKVALITGGTGWLGTSLSRALAEAGAAVVISSREASRASDAAAGLPTPGSATHYGVALDHTDPKSIASGFAAAVEAAGQVDGVGEPLGRVNGQREVPIGGCKPGQLEAFSDRIFIGPQDRTG